MTLGLFGTRTRAMMRRAAMATDADGRRGDDDDGRTGVGPPSHRTNDEPSTGAPARRVDLDMTHGVSWCVMVRHGDSIPASCVQPPIASSESNPFLHTARAAERATRIHSQQRKSPRPHEPSARAPTHRRRPPRRAPAGTRSPARAPTPTRRARPSDARPRSFIVERHRGVVRHEHARR